MTADSAPATARETIERLRKAIEGLKPDPWDRPYGDAWDGRDSAITSALDIVDEHTPALLALLSPPSETREIERLRAALKGLMPYRAHTRRCAYEMTETCTCGMRQAADSARRALTAAPEDRNGE